MSLIIRQVAFSIAIAVLTVAVAEFILWVLDGAPT
jgi:hypothetical protein